MPALPARSSALAAYAKLKPWVRAVTAPLWTVPPRTGPERLLGHRPDVLYDRDRVALAAHVRGRTVEILKAQGSFQAWVDAFHVEDEEGPVTGELWNHLLHSPVRPVTGVERPEWQQDVTARVARVSGNGLGIRVFLPDLPDERRAEALLRILDRLRADPVPLDLLLDLGSVTEEHHRADKWALHALDLLGALHGWRTVVVLAGSVPREVPDLAVGALAEPHRFDWDIPHMVLHDGEAREAPLPLLTYGDYGAQHARAADLPMDGGGGRPWGLLRYTTDRTFLLAKAPTAGEERAADVRALARRLIETEEYRGAGFSDGDSWLDGCARGAGRVGTGGAAEWITAGHSQHMSYVAHQLRA
ncbi:beta family protein [Streptomyces luteolus]|uniref:Beta protein n=1 Tax=Streptomyces luteolus TaxID=3043615 RepID=A0ABT6SWF9_9ACTN|nr:hypothetical protein [Streptomyces sp. B-S-A12]MDI3419453.1 hypothetical protein [Streptomyces sp. B-S-A12]